MTAAHCMGPIFCGPTSAHWREDPAQIDRWRRQYGFRHALVESGTAETVKRATFRRISAAPGWSLVGRCDAAALYQHR